MRCQWRSRNNACDYQLPAGGYLNSNRGSKMTHKNCGEQVIGIEREYLCEDGSTDICEEVCCERCGPIPESEVEE